MIYMYMQYTCLLCVNVHVYIGCLEGVHWLSGGCTLVVWRVYIGCLDGVDSATRKMDSVDSKPTQLSDKGCVCTLTSK